jgi:hypothetical protein
MPSRSIVLRGIERGVDVHHQPVAGVMIKR